MSRDACAKTGCGQSRDHAFHVWYQQATGGHTFVEPAESSDEATVREIAERRELWLEDESRFREVGTHELLSAIAREGFAAGRAAAFKECCIVAKAGDVVGDLQLIRKGVSNDCFGWWFVKTHDGRRPAAEGFISLPNLAAISRAGGTK